MSYPVNVSVQIKGGPELTDYRTLTVSQFMFSHHTFALDFSFEALAKALRIKPDAVHLRAHEQLSGQVLTITWTGNAPNGQTGTFKFRGVVTQTTTQTDSDLTRYYHVSGYGSPYLLDDGHRTRSFVRKSLQQIVQQVLGEYPSGMVKQAIKTRLNDKLPYVVQYGESNYQFLNRLAAQQGEWLYYDGQTLRLGPVPHMTARHFQSDSAQSFAVSMRLQPGATEGSHYNYRTHKPLKAKGTNPTGGHPFNQFALAKSEEVFTQPHRLQGDPHLSDHPQLKQSLDTAAARHAGSLVSLTGRGEIFDLVPGMLLDMHDAAGSAYGQFRVLNVHHRVDGDGNYYNNFEALPGAVNTPPAHALMGSPMAHSELAEVIDLADPRRLGRVRVRFQWQVEQPAQAESGWLRVSTPYSGDGKGQLFTPEKGSQVLIGYEQGRAEFPVVLGNLFHPHNAQGAAYTPANNQLKGLQTAGGNKVVMLDTAGAQTILLSNSNKKSTSLLISFEGDGSISLATNGPINLTSGDSISIAAKKNITFRAGEDILMAADKNILAETKDESISLRAQKELLLTAVSDDLTLEAAGKKLVAKAADNVEIAASGVAKISGSDIKWSKP